MEKKLFLWFIFYTTISAIEPPCEETDIELSCSERRLTSVPKVKVENKIELLDMSQNDLEDLYKADFMRYLYLVTIYLNDNAISYIEDNTFENLMDLEFIDLSKNLLAEIPENMIVQNKKLTMLDLSENLFLSHPPILSSDSLEVLDLSQCKINHFPNASIEQLPHLRLLYLNSNNLVTLDHRMFSIPKLFYYVQIDFNPWECSCNTVKMIKYLTDNKMFELSQPISCVNSNKSHIHIYDKKGPKMCKTKRKAHEDSTTLSNSIEIDGYANDIDLKNTYLDDDEKIIKGIESLEEILKNEKMYFLELKNEKTAFDSIAVWTLKVFILVIFFSGIALGLLISTLMSRRVRRAKSKLLLKTGSMTI